MSRNDEYSSRDLLLVIVCIHEGSRRWRKLVGCSCYPTAISDFPAHRFIYLQRESTNPLDTIALCCRDNLYRYPHISISSESNSHDIERRFVVGENSMVCGRIQDRSERSFIKILGIDTVKHAFDDSRVNIHLS